MAQVLVEAWEPVEDEKISAGDFRDFVFENPVRFWTATNPGFFRGTSVESAVEAFLPRQPSCAPPSTPS